jgi:enamine deaminase RidA (YjgF/YER057c/UK114 family)
MKKTAINPDTLAPPVGHFDRAVRIGPWLFISGTSALTHVTGDIATRKLSPTIEVQTRETLANIQRVCEAAGYALSDIYEIRFILRHREDFKAMNQILEEVLPDRGFIAHGYPGDLLHPDMLIEIEANAYKA